MAGGREIYIPKHVIEYLEQKENPRGLALGQLISIELGFPEPPERPPKPPKKPPGRPRKYVFDDIAVGQSKAFQMQFDAMGYPVDPNPVWMSLVRYMRKTGKVYDLQAKPWDRIYLVTRLK